MLSKIAVNMTLYQSNLIYINNHKLIMKISFYIKINIKTQI